MTSEYWMRKAHRYLGIFVGIQILLWVVSGLYFTWNDIEKVRGQHLTSDISKNIEIKSGQIAGVDQVLDSLRRSRDNIESINRVELRMLLDKPVYEITYIHNSSKAFQLFDARTGEILPILDEASAIQIAKDDFIEDSGVKSIELINTVTPHAEYRGRDLPIYRVVMDHPSNTNIYVSAQRGMVTARRNSTWRIFDFFWMTHTMDFATRDDFNNLVIQVFSVLGLITVISGFLLWGMSSTLFRKN